MLCRLFSCTILLTGCFVETNLDDSAYVHCTNASQCREGTDCVIELSRCMSDGPCLEMREGRLAPVAEGNACVADDGADGLCRAGLCQAHRCGDGHVGPTELCDDGNKNSNSAPGACRSDCAPAHCGDGVVDNGELCDAGPDNSDSIADACRSDCRPPSCGDDTEDSGEECDDGDSNSDTSANACRTTCLLPSCGDNVIDSSEQCDDGNDLDEDNCNACRLPGCGDGAVWSQQSGTEQCDDGNTVTEACAYGETECIICAEDCRFAAGATSYCGDGVIRAGEACDGGPVGCDACQIAPGFHCEGEPSWCARGLFVDSSATGAGDGSSWANAFVHLQDALSAADGLGSPAEIWVAAGVYVPDDGGGYTPGDREATFTLSSAVALYGGFSGTENARQQRDSVANPTILDGDLAGDDSPAFANRADNAYHVVRAADADATAVLDGFVVRGGEATEPGLEHGRGGGIRIERGAPVIRGCVFTDNRASGGAGLFMGTSSPLIDACRFEANESTSLGGGLRIIASDPVIVRTTITGNTANFGGGVHMTFGSRAVFLQCGFHGNAATSVGGAINGTDSLPLIVNSVFTFNSAGTSGGAVYSTDSSPTVINATFYGNSGFTFRTRDDDGAPSRPILINTVFWDATSDEVVGPAEVSYSCVRDTNPPGPGNIAGCVPSFVDPDGADDVPGTADDDARLAAGSPGLDAGNNDALPLDTYDLDDDGDRLEGLPIDFLVSNRRVDNTVDDTGFGSPPIVDMGAYEIP